MTLNETVSMEAAAALADRMRKEGGEGDDGRIAYGFELCTARTPSAHEMETLRNLLHRQRTRQGSDETNTAADPFTVVARVLLNLDETITKE